MESILPISTKVERNIKITDNKFIILENYFGFEGVSNIYSLDNEYKIIWYAEKPMSDDKYVNISYANELEIEAFTWDGFKVKINAINGKIINKSFSK